MPRLAGRLGLSPRLGQLGGLVSAHEPLIVLALLQVREGFVQPGFCLIQVAGQPLQPGADTVRFRRHPGTLKKCLGLLDVGSGSGRVTTMQLQAGQAQAGITPAAIPLPLIGDALGEGHGFSEGVLGGSKVIGQAVRLGQRVEQLLDPGHVGLGLLPQDVQVFVVIFGRQSGAPLAMIEPPQATVGHGQTGLVAQAELDRFRGLKSRHCLAPSVKAHIGLGQRVQYLGLLVRLPGALAGDL